MKDDDDDLDFDLDSLLDDEEDEDKKDKDEGNDDDDEAGASAEDEDSAKEEKARAKADDEEEKDTDEPKEEESVEAEEEEAEEKPKKRAATSEDDDDGDDGETEDKPEKKDPEAEGEEASEDEPKSVAADADTDDDDEAKKDEPEKEEPEAGDSEGSGRPKATDADLTIPQDTRLQMAQRLPAKGGAAAGDEKPQNLGPEVVAKLASAQAALKEADEALAEARAQMDGKAPKAELPEPAPEGGMDFQLVKEIAIPVVAFAIGAILHRSESTAVFGKLAMFFGAQTVMNLYMKEVLSGAVVDEEAGLHGFPSAFIVTALQQLVGFLCFGAVLIVLSCTPYAYTPKKISEPMEWLAVVLFSFSFTLNIALNNFSISLLPLSVNLIIRSCLPLATFVSQRAASQCTNEPVKDARAIEIFCMLLGVACAAVAVVAKSNGGGGGEGQSKTLVFGVIVCVASLFSGAINLALAGVLGTSCKLNSLDTTIYMSVPAFIFLVLPSLFYRHPVSWPDHGSMTDWEVMMVVLDKKLGVVGLAAFSGVLALFYNVFQYGIVHSLSASYTAFAGNFNKAATIALGLLVGLERLPPGVWGIVMALACLGNIGAFTAFNIIKVRAKKDEPKKEADGQGDEKADLIADADKNKV